MTHHIPQHIHSAAIGVPLPSVQASGEMGCSEEALAVVAMVSSDAIFHTHRDKQEEAAEARRRFIDSQGDHLTFLNVFRAFQAVGKKAQVTTTNSGHAGMPAGGGCRCKHGCSLTHTHSEHKSACLSPGAPNAASFCCRTCVVRQLPLAALPSGSGQVRWCRENFVNVRSLRKALDVYQQLRGHLEGLGIPLKSAGEDATLLRRALVAGLFPHAAKRQMDGEHCQPAFLPVAPRAIAAARQASRRRLPAPADV